jgi:hypothetical protein
LPPILVNQNRIFFELTFIRDQFTIFISNPDVGQIFSMDLNFLNQAPGTPPPTTGPGTGPDSLSEKEIITVVGVVGGVGGLIIIIVLLVVILVVLRKRKNFRRKKEKSGNYVEMNGSLSSPGSKNTDETLVDPNKYATHPNFFAANNRTSGHTDSKIKNSKIYLYLFLDFVMEFNNENIYKKDVKIVKKIGEGNFGAIFTGSWNNTPVKKIIYRFEK